MNVLDDAIDFDAYFRDAGEDPAKIKPASAWADGVVDRFYGSGAATNWVPIGFDKMAGKFDLRPAEVTLWSGINKHGKTTFLSQVMLNAMNSGQKICVASMEMKPIATMAKMTRQAGGTDQPTIPYIRGFHSWTDGKLWLYDHVGRVEASRMLAVAKYVRAELGVDHIVIDSLMKCSIGEDDYNGQKDFVDGLCAIARDTGLGIHLVAHMRKGENELQPPNKFDVRGAAVITDMVDNIVIVWKNLRKFQKPDDEQDPSVPDCFVRVAGQRHHSWEGNFSFWFNRSTEQFREHQNSRVAHIDLDQFAEA